MKTTRQIEYKCRRCGETFAWAKMPAKEAVGAMRLAAIDHFDGKDGPVIPTIVKHFCEDDGIGLSDIIGVGPATEVKPAPEGAQPRERTE